ncbi:uncharacterized protein [Antedon mediterranea]|uniref:uncharacterized protein n=1 Tax=Antedon mediterranea TaxID=105859 RepID=UPI003AF4F781
MEENVYNVNQINSDRNQLQALILVAREVEEYYKTTPPFMWSDCYKHGLPNENLILLNMHPDEVNDPIRQNFLTVTEDVGICRTICRNLADEAGDLYPRIRATANFLAHAILDHVKKKFTFSFETGDRILLRKAVSVITNMEKHKRANIIKKLIQRRRKATVYLLALRKSRKSKKKLVKSPKRTNKCTQTFMTSNETSQQFMTSTPNKSQSLPTSNLFNLNISPCKRSQAVQTHHPSSKRPRFLESASALTITPRRLELHCDPSSGQTSTSSGSSTALVSNMQQARPAISDHRQHYYQTRPTNVISEKVGVRTCRVTLPTNHAKYKCTRPVSCSLVNAFQTPANQATSSNLSNGNAVILSANHNRNHVQSAYNAVQLLTNQNTSKNASTVWRSTSVNLVEPSVNHNPSLLMETVHGSPYRCYSK